VILGELLGIDARDVILRTHFDAPGLLDASIV
jgi:hypothetical protein